MAALLLLMLTAAPEWKAEGTRHGMLIESREVPGSRFTEFRAQTEAPGEVDALCDAIFDWATASGTSPEIARRTVLEDRGDARLVHDDLQAPIVANRTVTFLIKKARPSPGLCTLEAHVDNERAPKTPEGWVRLEKMDTHWRFEPGASGKTKVTFRLFVDPAGSVPPFLTFGPQRNATADTLKRALEKVTKR